MKDINSYIVKNHHETLDFCSSIGQSTVEYFTYRPNNGLVASRNHYLHQMMNFKNHTPEY